jgi:hypothetical protein
VRNLEYASLSAPLFWDTTRLSILRLCRRFVTSMDRIVDRQGDRFAESGTI